MKKIFLVITIILLTCACSSSYLKKINYKKLDDIIHNKETFILYLTDGTVEGNTLKRTLLNVSKNNNIKTYYLNTKDLNTNDKRALQLKFKFEDSNIIVFVKKGVEETTLSRVDDLYISEKNLKQEFKTQGFIK